MKIAPRHDWAVSVPQAIALQERLRREVITEDRLGEVRHIAGIDVGFEDEGRIARAAVAVLDFPALTVHETALGRCPVTFPYVPGLLSFREIPAVLAAFERLRTAPDLLLCDGQGLAHPRRFGIACHLGVLTDIPSIGVAKTRLVGTHAEVAAHKGAWQPLYDKGEIIGAALRTRDHVSPLYISSGHRLSLPTAIDYVLRAITRYRLPETTRWAHRLASGDS